MLPFSEDTIRVLASLTQCGTPQQLRAALEASPDAMSFALRSVDESVEPGIAGSNPPDGNELDNTTDAPLVNSVNSFLIICELENNSDSGTAEIASSSGAAAGNSLSTRLFATTNSTSLFRQLSFATSPPSDAGYHGSSGLSSLALPRRHGVTPHRRVTALSCILIERRPSRREVADQGASSSPVPLSLKDIYIQSMDLQHPLNTLQSLLLSIYDPILRTHRKRAGLREHVQDLLTGIRSMNQVLPEIDITRFVHEDLLQLCHEHPTLDELSLINRLGPLANDPSFINRILQTFNKCIKVFTLEPILSGQREEEELAKKLQQQRQNLGCTSGSVSALALAGGSAPGGVFSAGFVGDSSASFPADGGEDEDTARAVQDRIVYWKHVLVWLEDVRLQLDCREWRLLTRLIRDRVKTNYVTEFTRHVDLVKRYNNFLQTIPEKRLATVENMSQLTTVIHEILDAVAEPSVFALRLILCLLRSLVSEIARCWVVVMENQRILVLDQDPETDGYSSSNAAGDTSAPAEGTDMLTTLQTLRLAIETLRMLQARYIEQTTDIRRKLKITLGYKEDAAHPRVVALLTRCIAIRTLVESHMLLMQRLGVTFAVQMRISFEISEAETHRGTAEEAAQPGLEYAVQMQEAYNGCVRSICGVQDSTEELLGETLRHRHHGIKGENCLWRISTAAQSRFDAAVLLYHQQRDRCDEQLATLVSQLLSNEQNSMDGRGSDAPLHSSTAGGVRTSSTPLLMDSYGIRVFRTYKSFKSLPLEKVQSVLRSYRVAVLEKLSVYVKGAQESFVSMQAAKEVFDFNISRYRVSSAVVQIIREQRLEKVLSDSIIRLDYVREHGWHELLSLRNVENYWRLDETLANFIGFSVDDLATNDLQKDSEVHGCAIALAFLNLYYATDADEWDRDPSLLAAKELVKTNSPKSLGIARERLLVVRGTKNDPEGEKGSAIYSSRNLIRARIIKHVRSWFDEVQCLMSSIAVDEQSLLLSGSVLRAVRCGAPSSPSEAGDVNVSPFHRSESVPLSNRNAPGASARGQSSSLQQQQQQKRASTAFAPRESPSPFSGAASSLSTSSPAPAAVGSSQRWMIEVAFPWSFKTISEDIRYLEGVQLLSCICGPGAHRGSMSQASWGGTRRGSVGDSLSHSSSVSQRQFQKISLTYLRDVMRTNEVRGRAAQTLFELIRLYYVTVNGEDGNLVLLVTEEYEEVNQLLQTGFSLRWCDEGLISYVQQLTNIIQKFMIAVQQVRRSTQVVYKKIKAFHVCAFEPEAIIQRVKVIRSIVDQLALRCVNAHIWTRRTQTMLEQALLAQMKYLIRDWAEDFKSMRYDIRFLEKGQTTKKFQLSPLRVRMRVVYNRVRLDSTAPVWRLHWINELNRYLSWIDVLPRLYREEDTRVAGGSDQADYLASGGLRSLPSAAQFAKSGNPSSATEGGQYSHLLLKLPLFVLADALTAIEQCISDAIETENEWRRSQQFLSLDVAVMQQRFGTDLKRWSKTLELMRTVTSRIMDYTQPNKLLGGVVIISQGAQMELGRKLDQVMQCTHAKFKDILCGELEAMYHRVIQERDEVGALDLTGNIRDVATFLLKSPQLQSDIDTGVTQLALMSAAEKDLLQLGHTFPEYWISAANVQMEFNSLKSLVAQKMKVVEDRRPMQLDEIKAISEELEATIRDLDERFRSLDSDATRKAPVIAQETMARLFEAAVELDDEAKRIVAIQTALGETPRSFVVLQRLMNDISALKDVWKHVSSAYTELNELGATPFFEMVPRLLQERLQSIEAATEAYPSSVHGFQLYQDLVEQVHEVLSYHRLMLDLRSDAMSPLERAQQHWSALRQKLRTSWVLEDLTVQDIWDSDPRKNAATYNEVVEVAQGERRIEVQLHNISNYWSAFQFSVIVYKKQVGLIRGWDTVFERLTEDLSTFGGIRASPYFNSQQLVAMTNDVEGRLDQLRQILELLFDVQRRWVYLDGIFSGNSEVKSQLPQDAMKFDRTSRELLHVLPRPRSSGELPEVHPSFFLEDEKLLATLGRLQSQLSAVQRALTSYLDTQRSRFPRFFFVGDDDLLEIMGNSRNPILLNKHLKKMFTAVATLVLDGDVKATATQIKSFSSSEGEELLFLPGPIPFRQRAINEWLRDAELGVARTLRTTTLEAYNELQKSEHHYAPLWTMDWIAKLPVQVLCLTLQLIWTQSQEEYLTNSPRQSAASTTAEESPIVQQMSELLENLANGVLDNRMQVSLRSRCEQLITVAVYQRDVSRSLVTRDVNNAADFDWLSVLRLYAMESNKSSGGAVSGGGNYGSVQGGIVECRMADASLEHGFEYIGAHEHLVQTPLTDACYLTLMQALHTRLGGSPVGPAGTGKTETVKALGMQLGRHVLVFNCDDTFDFQAVSRIFLGLCQVGAWGCFDEFNRLEERILSALSLQIQVIQESLRSHLPQVHLNKHDIPLNPNVAIFVTMNPGYAGRSKLPGNLKRLFRTVTMSIPDRETIAEVMLFAQGFRSSEDLSRKVVPLFHLCAEQFSQQAHYDFGLRALKSVLVAAGWQRRERPLASTPSSASAEATREQECSILLESIIATIAPKLVTPDVPLFYALLQDFFPDVAIPSMAMRELRETILQVCAIGGLSVPPNWVEKVLQLHHTKLTRHGVMIVGPSGSGKTSAWKTLMAAMVRMDRQKEMHAYVISPKVLNKAELFGVLDITTREWKDGVFTSILRRIIDAEEQQRLPEDVALEGNTDVQSNLDGPASKTPLANVKVPPSSSAVPMTSHPTTKPRHGEEIFEVLSMTPLENAKTLTGNGETEERVEKEHWIIFDGDVDPEWVENLNSVLDDNRLLTLPNGERLPLPSSVRIFFEVQDLRYATPATISRCGMLWFSEGLVPLPEILAHAFHQLLERPTIDQRGRRVRWNLEDDFIGVVGQRQTVLADCLLSGSYGKTYHEYIVSNTSPSVELMLGSCSHFPGSMEGSPRAPRPGHGGSTRSGSTIGQNCNTPFNALTDLSLTSALNATNSGAANARFGGGPAASVVQSGRHPDAERIEEVMINAWASAFEESGLIMRGLQLLRSAEYETACIMELDQIQTLQSILSLLLSGVWRTFEAEQQNGSGVFDEMLLQKIAACVLDYSVFWGLASSMNYERRLQLAKDLCINPIIDGVAQSILDIEVDYRTGEWQLIRHRVTKTTIQAEQVGANDTVIATVDTCRHKDILGAWIGAGKSAVLCGPPGSGKTMSITAVLNSLPEYEVVFLNFSSGTTISTILKALEQNCAVQDTARGLVMAPTSGKQLLLFCDEINLPALDHYGTQVVVQMLRQLIERKGFYRPRDNAWIIVEKVQVVGACNPPTDPGRVPLTRRFLRWAPVLLVDFPSPESLITIYSTYCRAILAWDVHLYDNIALRLAQAMVQMYRTSQARFTPIQQPHYLYSPRELSRWSRALYEGMMTWEASERRDISVEKVVRLAVHEGLRVFSDRLVSAEEREWTDTTIDACFKEWFTDLQSGTLDRPLLYSTLLSRNYADSTRDALRAYLQKKLTAFNEEEMTGDLVIYDAMIDHVVRIDRVLRQPLGHLLLAGASGVGKTVLTRLVAWIRGYRMFSLKVHRDYNLDDFENDLRALLRRSGCKRERVCFIFDESNILQPSFIEYMNALLASGEVPGLFEGEEWSKLMQEIRDAVLTNQNHAVRGNISSGGGAAVVGGGDISGGVGGISAGSRGGSGVGVRLKGNQQLGRGSYADLTASNRRLSSIKSNDNHTEEEELLTSSAPNIPLTTDDMVDVNNEGELYHWFLKNVREHLHVVLTINPASGEFSSRTVASPALVNRCTIDWFGDWSFTTLRHVARERIQNLVFLPSFGGAFDVEEDVHEAIVEVLSSTHVSTQVVSHALRVRNVNEGSFITPRHFSDSVSHFVAVFQQKVKVFSATTLHLHSGLQKLQETSDEVTSQQAVLRNSEAEIEASGKAAQEMLDRIVTETEITKKEKAAAEAMEKQLQEEHLSISEDAQRVSAELAEAEPALKDADAALSTVKPEYLREIRAYTTPPPMVKRVLEAVIVLMGEKNGDDWDVLKGYIRREDFISSVKSFKPENITSAAQERVLAMMKDTKFTVEAAYRASKAAGPLLQWVFAQAQYSAIFSRVAPTRLLIQRLSAERDVKLKALEKTQSDVREKELFLSQLKMEYQQATTQISSLKQRIVVVAAKCDRAKTILQQLMDEKSRWSSEAESINSEARTMVGDCLISSFFLSYMGFFDEYTRQHVLQPRWIKRLNRALLPVREGISVTEYLSPATQQLAWEEAGLPKDRLCIDNAAIMHNCKRYVLLIDPTGVGATFLQRYYASAKIAKASFTRQGYMKQLEMAVRFGYPMLLEDVEYMDPALYSLLNGEVRCYGSRFITRIGPYEVDLAPTFRLFLHTRNPSYQPPPDLAGQVCVVNFTVTVSSLQSQCLHYMLLHERPDVDEKRTRLLKAQGEYQLRLRVLEENLLTLIAESEGSLLANDSLIKSLAALKEEATQIALDIDGSTKSLQDIHVVESQYRPVAALVAQSHFALKRFSELNTFYQYDVNFVLHVLADALQELPPAASVSDVAAYPHGTDTETSRLHLLCFYIFVLLHQRGVRGMFREDHMMWAVRLAQLRSAMAPIHPGTTNGAAVAEEEWEWIINSLRGAANYTAASPSPNGGEDGGSSGSLDNKSATVLPPVITKVCPQLGRQGREGILLLLAKPAFREIRLTLLTKPAVWETVLKTAAPLLAAQQQLSPDCFPRGTSATRRIFLLTLLLLHIRRDAFEVAMQQLLETFFSPAEMNLGDDAAVAKGRCGTFYDKHATELANVVEELSGDTPLLLVADATYDPALHVEELARRTSTPLAAVAMGSLESVESANYLLGKAMKTGGWVLLKNIHLARSYADKLERQLHFQQAEQQLHSGFRLFMTAERDASTAESVADSSSAMLAPTTTLPINLLEASVMVVYEAPPGMRSSLLQTYGPMAKQADQLFNAETAENDLLQRLYLSAAWTHSVIVERIVHKPLGWSEAYEFTDVEFQRFIDAIQAWTRKDDGSLHVAWSALRAIVAETIYGGKMCNLFDQHLLRILCAKVLQPEALKDGAQLVPDCSSALMQPPPVVGHTPAALMAWVQQLPGGSSNPMWLGLPEGADRVARCRRATEIVERLSRVQMILDDSLSLESEPGEEAELGMEMGQDSGLYASSQSGDKGAAAPTTLQSTRWATMLESFCAAWYPVLCDGLQRLQQHPFAAHALQQQNMEGTKTFTSSGSDASAGVTPPLVLAVQREVLAAIHLLKHLVTDVRELQEVVREERTPSSVHRLLISAITKNHVPPRWAEHLRSIHGSVAHSLFVSAWMCDVQQRTEHWLALATAAQKEGRIPMPVNLGLLFSPGSFLTAFKQQHARTRRVPLERLYPQISMRAATPADAVKRRISAQGGTEEEMTFVGLMLFSAQVLPSGRCVLSSTSSADSASGGGGTSDGAVAPALSTPIVLQWRWSAGEPSTDTAAIPLALRLKKQEDSQTLLFPFYATENRETLLEVLELPVEPGIASADIWYERGVCIAAWTPTF